MTLKGDAIFKEKLIGGLKKGKRNLVNFHAGSRKSENLHSDALVLSKVNSFRWKSSFKVGNVPEIINKEVLAQLIPKLFIMKKLKILYSSYTYWARSVNKS